MALVSNFARCALDVDGALLLAEDVATGVRIERGQVVFPDESGTGVVLRACSPLT